jgi:creatinine amidohydrolase
MKILEMNWTQVEAYLRRDDRAVVPIGSTEQHAGLSLGTDVVLAERVSVEAAEPLGVPVFPSLGYGYTPYFTAYPGTVCLRIETLIAVVRDVLDSLRRSGFRRILIVNGHGGNAPAGALLSEWMADHPGTCVKFHSWYDAPRVSAKVQDIDPVAGHASWMENFPWTRLEGIEQPAGSKPAQDIAPLRGGDPAEVRVLLGDGSLGGFYERPDEDVLRVWAAGVEETRDLLEHGWRGG